MLRAGALLAVVLWGLSFVATKIALRELSPAVLVATRFLMGTIVLVGVMGLRREPLPPRAAWPSIALVGVVGITLHQLLQVNGLARTSATNTGWLIGLIPIWSALLAAALLGERLVPTRVAGLALGFAGALLVVTGGRPALPSGAGDLLVIASTLTWALATVAGRSAAARVGGLATTTWAMAFGTALLVPFFLAGSGAGQLARLSDGGWGAVAFLGIGCSGIGYLAWNAALARLEATQVAALLYVEPLVTLAAATTVLGERVHWSGVAGGVVVLAGVALVQRRPAAGAA